MKVETCKGCKHRKRCNGRVAKNSKCCRDLRSNYKVEDSFTSFFRKFRGLTKDVILEKYVESKEKNV